MTASVVNQDGNTQKVKNKTKQQQQQQQQTKQNKKEKKKLWHHWSQSNPTPRSVACWCHLKCVIQPQELQGPLHAIKQHVKRVLSSAPTPTPTPTPTLLALSPTSTSRSSSTAWRTTMHTSFIAPDALNFTSVKLDASLTPASENTLRTFKRRRDKPVADHFNETDHIIHSIRVNGLWLLFTDSVNDRKNTESHSIDKLGNRKPGGVNERL